MSRYDDLIDHLCIEMGWCGSKIDGKYRHVDDYLPREGWVTAQDFARWVIEADGEDPDGPWAQKKKWAYKIASVFEKYMGSDRVRAAEFEP